MTIRVYLDNNATTRPHPEVIAAMRQYQEDMYLNASSAAGELLGAARPLADARKAMAQLLGATEDDRIVLTSGATEANAWVFRATPPGGHIVTSQVEHSSILAAAEQAQRPGHRVDLVGVDKNGLIRPDEMVGLLRPDTRLISLQLANNETGAIQPLEELAALAREVVPGVLIHSDATQAVGRIPIDLSGSLAEIDLLSFSAHKFHGPKGVGGLVLREGVFIEPLIPGEQESGLRGGTSNVPAAAGLAEAARIALSRLVLKPDVSALRDRLEAAISSEWPGVEINAAGAVRLPNTSSISISNIDAEDVVEHLAARGICIATGSACSAGATAPSHVLTAMGLSSALARSTLRFSLSVETSGSDIEQLLSAISPLLKSQLQGAIFASRSSPSPGRGLGLGMAQ
jgi:cysteine desulfurase